MYVMALDASGDAAAVGSGVDHAAVLGASGMEVDVDHFIRHGVLRCPPRSRRVIDTRASRDRADPARKASLALAAAAGIAMLGAPRGGRPLLRPPTPTPRRTAKVWTISSSYFGDDTKPARRGKTCS